MRIERDEETNDKATNSLGLRDSFARALQFPTAVFLAAAVWLTAIPVWAFTKPDPNAAAHVHRTLAAEAKGGDAARDRQLASVIEAAPDYAPARWAAGFVEHDGTWMKFDSVPEAQAANEPLDEYRRMRDGMSDTAAGNLTLANWCHQHGLKEQETAHLLRVLDFEPNRTDVRARLGMVEVGGVLMMPREAREAAARGRQAGVDLKRWLPRVERLRAEFAAASGRVRSVAEQHVRAIREPSAILALETVLAPTSDEAGQAVVDALAVIHRPEAAIALARLATFSESSDVTDAARDKLKTLPLENFVPAMLSSLMVAPDAVQTAVGRADQYGRMLFEQAYVYERSDRKIVAVFDNVYRWERTYNEPDDSSAILTSSALGSARTAQRAIAADVQNRQFERTNRRIIDTLRVVTGQQLPYDPKVWWQWWDDYNEVAACEKPTQCAYFLDQTGVGRQPPPVKRKTHSCLIAGTPIWTDRGPVAVEKMHVGDRVLSQDPVTGALAYKPVVRPTVRPRAPLVHVTLPDETIVASGGHPFWVAGQGWLTVRHLRPGMRIHTVTGTVPVRKVEIEEDGKQPVYNLVVEDFHDYFAGNSHLLLHDNTPREPTVGPVPGLTD